VRRERALDNESRPKIDKEAWARRHDDSGTVKVTEGTFTYVAIGADRRARQLPPE